MTTLTENNLTVKKSETEIKETPILLKTDKVAEFVGNGFLRFDEIIPKDICKVVQKEIDDGDLMGHIYRFGGLPLSKVWTDKKIRKVLDNPIVAGAIQSLVGRDPRFDHYAAHRTQPGQKSGDSLHQDAVFDPRRDNFDIQLSIFFEDTTPEMGGTRFIPGSHFRRVHTQTPQRYHNLRGQVQSVCKAGTVVIWHTNIWHSARDNNSDKQRTMFKIRLNPQEPQIKIWDTSDLLDFQYAGSGLFKTHGWMAGQERIEIINRIKLWRALTANPNFDVDSWLNRINATGQISPDYDHPQQLH
jgi:hypothetical protein